MQPKYEENSLKLDHPKLLVYLFPKNTNFQKRSSEQLFVHFVERKVKLTMEMFSVAQKVKKNESIIAFYYIN